MIRAVALGLALVVTALLTGCGIVVAEEAPTDLIQIDAPGLVPVFPEVEAIAAAPVSSLPTPRARADARRAALQIRIPACDDDSAGRGFAIGSHTLVAPRNALSGAGFVRVWTANRRSTAVGAATVYRVGALGVATVARAVPRRLALGRSIGSGTPVTAVVERNGKLRMLPGVAVDSVPGAPFGVRGTVLRLTSDLRDGDVGPVLDAKGRVVGAVFAVDPGTTLGLALPVSALQGRGPARTLDALEACD